MMNIEVPSSNICNIHRITPQMSGLHISNRGLTISVLISNRDPNLSVAVHLLVVDVPLVPGVGVLQVLLGLHQLPDDQASHRDLDVNPMQRLGNVCWCQNNVKC